MKLLFLEPDERIEQVLPEIFGRQAYIAQDVRRDVLIMAQSGPSLALGIHETTNENAKLSSLYESATLKLKSGRHGSFQILRLPFEEFPQWYDLHRKRYKRRVVVTRNGEKWKRVKMEEKPTNADAVDEIEICS